jgi:DNA (cytosine-5)-methyltransferase 1
MNFACQDKIKHILVSIAVCAAAVLASVAVPPVAQAQIKEAEWKVRLLTPVECERLQGFPDGYTNIPWRGKNGAPDGSRYRVLGNSMSANVMRWLGRRIEMVENICK